MKRENVGILTDNLPLTVGAAELMQMLLQIDIEWFSVWNIMEFSGEMEKKFDKLIDEYVRFMSENFTFNRVGAIAHYPERNLENVSFSLLTKNKKQR